MLASNTLFHSLSRLTGRFLYLARESAKKHRVRRRSPKSVHIESRSENLEDRTLLTVYLVNTASDAAIEGGGAVNGKLSLREAITAANTNAAFGDAGAGSIDGDVILFDPRVFGDGLAQTITLTRGQMIISDDVRIDGRGQGITIDANDQSRIFEIIEDAANPITISNLRFANGNAFNQDGGAIRVRGGVGVTLFNNTFENNYGGRGGAVSNNDSIVVLRDSTLSNNSVFLDGGAIWNNGGTTSVVGGVVSGNEAMRRGGAVMNSAGTFVARENAYFTDNKACGDGFLDGGGAIYQETGTLTLNNVTLAGNTADGDEGMGGGIFVDDGQATIVDSRIRGNTAFGAGGGIGVFGGNVVLRYTHLGGDLIGEGNLAGPPGVANPGNGGGLYVEFGNVDIIGGSILSNDAFQSGGGVYNFDGTVTIRDGVLIEGNDAHGPRSIDGGGGIYNLAGALTIRDSIIRSNHALSSDPITGAGKSSGGGVFSFDGDVSIYNTTISGNSANRAGGGIEVLHGILFMSNSTLGGVELADGNVAGPPGGATPGNGGALHVSFDATVIIDSGLIQNNVASREGGGLWNSSTGTMVIRNGVSIIDNVAKGNAADDGGGGIFNDGGRLAITSSVIRGNSATGTLGSGGGIFSAGGLVTVAGSTIAANVANRAGGGIEIVNGTADLNFNIIGGLTFADGNIAGPAGSASPGNGGGLHISGSARTFINGGLVQYNSAASEGGGLWNQSGSQMYVRDGVIVRNNTASGVSTAQGGGGIFNNGGYVALADAFIRDNTATSDAGGGGGILNDGGIVFGVNSTVSGNVATGTSGSGGGILSTSGVVRMDGSRISANTAARAGGGIEVEDGIVRLTQSVLGGFLASDGNIAGGANANPGNGGGLHVSGIATVYITTTRVENNTAASEGGGLWNQAGSTMIIRDNSVITRNIAEGDAFDNGGGGIFNNGGRLAISDSEVSQNDANGTAGSGGGIFSTDGLVTVLRSDIIGNTANRAGGGIEVVNGSVVLTDSALNENEAGPVGSANPGNGGGLHVTGSATVFVTNTEVIGNVAANEGGGLWNQAGSTMYVNMGSYIGFNLVTGLNANDGGGGIFNNMGSLSISDSTLDRNAANGSGGGVFNNGGSVSIVRSTLSGNFAGSASSAGGGGLFNSSGADARIVNSTFSGNTANHNGGGIENFGSVSIFNSTLVLNRANEDALGAPNGGSGGGIHTLSGAFTELYNTIVAGNRRFANTVDDDINGGMVFAGSSFNIVGNAVTSGGLTDAVNSNIVGVGGIGTRALATIVSPTLGDNGGPTLTHALVAGSVGINSGGVGFLPAGVTTDQRGFPRLNGILDRGAFEL